MALNIYYQNLRVQGSNTSLVYLAAEALRHSISCPCMSFIKQRMYGSLVIGPGLWNVLMCYSMCRRLCKRLHSKQTTTLRADGHYGCVMRSCFSLFIGRARTRIVLISALLIRACYDAGSRVMPLYETTYSHRPEGILQCKRQKLPNQRIRVTIVRTHINSPNTFLNASPNVFPSALANGQVTKIAANRQIDLGLPV